MSKKKTFPRPPVTQDAEKFHDGPTNTSSTNTIPKRRCLFPTLMSEPDPVPLSEPDPVPLSEPDPVPLSEPDPVPLSDPAETSEPQQKAGIFNPPATKRLKRTRKLEPAPVPLSEPAPVPLSEPAPGLLSEPAPGLLSEPAPVPLSEPAPGLLSEPAPGLLSEPAPGLLSEPAPGLLSEPAPGLLSEPAPGLLSEPAPGLLSEPAPGLLSEPAPGLLSEPAPGLLSEPPESMKSKEMEIPGPPATKRLKRTRKLEPTPAPLSEPPDTRKSKKKKIIPGPPASQQVKRSRCPPSPWTPNLVEIRRRTPTARPPTCEIGVTTFTLRSKVATSPTLKSGVVTSPSSGEAFSTSPERKKMRKKNRKRARCSGAAVPTPPERKMKKRARCCPVPLNNPLSVCQSQRATQGRKACVWCKQEKEWMKTIWQCEACQVALCLIPGRNCFRTWHKTHKWNEEVIFSLFS
ncbi:proteoglycan 4-like isoform X2 [Oncorhynchus tshawytscha]|nr:proteoglycan 4-like isoform X2 [Oncorhynchus tshawytscha]